MINRLCQGDLSAKHTFTRTQFVSHSALQSGIDQCVLRHAGFGDTIKFVGGINKPKLVQCLDSAGSSHRQVH